MCRRTAATAADLSAGRGQPRAGGGA
jgi:hypothetical protein